MAYVVRVNGMVIGTEILTIEEVKKLNGVAEISLEKVLTD